MWEWIQQHAGWFFGLSAFSFVATLVVIPILLTRMPADYFLYHRREAPFARLHPALRLIVLTVKNVIAILLVLAGIVLSIPAVPGQGLLTILIGITLLDLPGKRRLELWIVRRPHVFKAINWIRRKAHRPPLQLPPTSP